MKCAWCNTMGRWCLCMKCAWCNTMGRWCLCMKCAWCNTMGRWCLCPPVLFVLSLLYDRLPYYLCVPLWHLSLVSAFSRRANQAFISFIGILPPGYTLPFLQCHLLDHREQSRINCSFSLSVYLTQTVLFTAIVLNGFQWNLTLGSCHYPCWRKTL